MGHLTPGLPLVVRLAGRLVVAVGGGPVTARRVRAFVDEGADVRVVSPWVCEDVLDLVREGRLEWQAREYAGAADLDGAWLVHTATGDVLVDRRVAADAQSLRIWCVDATDAASTTASVPARATVELPDGPVTVAAYAGGDPGLATVVRDAVEDGLRRGALPLRRTRPRPDGLGWVALVGGGPGTDGLLTARGHELLAGADVVVVDRLAPRALVERLPAGVRVIDVGKTPGHHPVPQEAINAILVEEAQRGLGVVRLKGGDPFVLGRGGEERAACEAHGIPVEVVPGVTSAIAVPAAAGIPVTHRGVARGFTVVTGHDDIPTLPTGGDHTVVLLMGITRLARTAELLVLHGRDPETPVAVIERGFAPTQRTTIGTLSTIAALAAERGVQAPAVVVVGDVVRLATPQDEPA
ncbi:MAG TPA: uroporphyrinogen-III C-methyltransferase [Intrasporangium sp.]|uniref:uroporphyrinogen-III C-methyltransferase n=1 Tax=Intrasporangium sp. TaxID=1925024 RepID=UPI002D78DA3D|nr:uroporphyrinogen-III C-methyltransferase [Intrasporangium sp.]HET7398548.1 uroporphyrinogen-III C-methyltransferase [Intrasporangium sp.]